VQTKKLFVVIAHKADRVLCLKATSKVDRYCADEKLLKGVLSYKVGQCPCFTLPTVIDPDNQFEINHSDLIAHDNDGGLQITGHLPSSAKRKLIEAIKHSFTMDSRQQEQLIALL
jgi:hypothetical protein